MTPSSTPRIVLPGRRALAACTLLVATASPLRAQRLDPTAATAAPPGPSRTYVGLGLLLGQPVGDFHRYVGVSGGIGGHVLHQFDGQGIVALRADVNFLIYGHQSRSFQPFANAPEIQGRVTTDNTIIFGGIGPQLMAPTGQVRPYITGAVGFAYFATSSSVSGQNGNESLFNTTNFHDETVAWNGGGGLYIPVRTGLRPISIDLGAQYQANGRVRYLRSGSIQQTGNSISFTPVESQANLIIYHLGVTIGL